jgi:copper chaperone CopZ
MSKSRRVQRIVVLTLAAILLSPLTADAQSRGKGEDKSTKLTLTLHGAHCKDCVARMRTSLTKLKGVKFKNEDIKPATKPRRLRPRYFSPLFEVTIENVEATNIGVFASAVKKDGTPHEDDVETGVDLVLFPSKMMSEELIMDLRSALRDVNGVEVDASGGLGGNLKEGWVWIRLEDAGGAGLEEVLRAARSVDREIRTTKKKSQ